MSGDPNVNWDAIVIGGGPAGLSAALMLGRSRRRVLLVDAGVQRNRFADHMHGALGNEETSTARSPRGSPCGRRGRCSTWRPTNSTASL